MKKKNKKYNTSEDFRRALEERIRKVSESENKTINDIMYKVAFDRFLARIFCNGNENWILKGGYSLELRFKDIAGISRTTTDIDFADIEPAKILIISTEKQFAEKIHAYTNPLLINNSRTRDLVDLMIYIDQGFKNKELLKNEISLTFKIRDTHEVPKIILEPPQEWEKPYYNLANKWGASKVSLKEAHKHLSNFWSALYNKLI